MMATQLSDLVGLHELTGVDMSHESTEESYYDDAQVINFVLDGVTYSAVEDPSDGYRSSMREIRVSNFNVTNTFQSVQVMCVMRAEQFSDYGDDVLDCYDTKNGKLVLSVGTRNYSDYYPTWEAVFTPENMSINEGQS